MIQASAGHHKITRLRNPPHLRTLLQLLVVLFAMAGGGCAKYRYETTVLYFPFTEIDTLEILVHQRHAKVQGVALLIPHYDSLYHDTHKHIVGPLTRKKLKVVEVRKFAYADLLVRAGTDDFNLYLNTITNGFTHYRNLNPQDTALPLNLVGVHEGAVVAPRIASIFNPDIVVLINPHLQSYRMLLMELASNDTLQRFKELCADIHIGSADEAFAWMHYIDISDPFDRFLGGRSVKYWKSYFDYNPSEYFDACSMPVYALQFEDFHLFTQGEQLYQTHFFKNKPFFSQTLPGTGTSRKNYPEIEKWLYRKVTYKRL